MGRSITRRMFLKGSGGATLMLPLLPSLLPREAWGQAVNPIRRYFSIVGGYDYGHHQHWFPTLNQLSNVHTPNNGDASFRYQALNSFLSNQNQDLSLILGRGLNPYINKVNLFRGLNLHTRIAHGRGHMLGNVAATDGHDNQVTLLKALPTIDQVLATNRNFTPHLRDPLMLGGNYSYRRDANGNVTQASANWPKPNQLFNTLFNPGGMPLPESGQSTSNAHPRRDLLTRVMSDYQRVRGGRQISSSDGRVLDSIMDQISDLQSRLGITTTSAGCRYSDINTSQSSSDGIGSLWNYNVEQHAYAYDLYAQIYAAAASCDIHRVFNFHVSITDNFDRNNTEDFHQGHSHRPWDIIVENGNRVNHRYMAEIWRMHVDRFLVPLVRSLDAHAEGSGRTILDNSLVHMTLESSVLHCDSNKPCLMIGSAGGSLTTGHFIDYSRRDLAPVPLQGDNFNENPSDARFGHAYTGQHYNRSLTTVLRAMGLQPAEYEDPTINTFFQGRTDGLIGAHNNGITRIGGYGHIGSQTSGVWYYNNSQLYQNEYGRQNYHFYKESLPLPPGSAS